MKERTKSIVYPLLLLAALLVLWFIANRYLGVPYYVLPPVEGVLAALYRGYVQGDFWGDFGFTLASMAIGYVGGCTAAFIIGVLFAEYRWLERLLYPFVLALQSMPKVALAPLILVWFGFGLESKAIMVALVCFFPMFINTAVGLEATDPALLDLMRAFSASRWHILTRIKIPSAASHIFAALQISVVLGLIGAVVAEFVSSSKGLGYLINAATTTLDTSTMFAALISLAVLGIAGSQLIRVLHRKLVFWDRGEAGRTLTE
ncbi:ABC transporter inner membrane protein [Bordetella pertussis]|uniref:ABC transport proteins, inner membrane component n=4 Tax=Bordetella pertussis TaxID=520 RepID=Q7VV38_BORPE|nr:ABC transporter permease [Bordetella pertussis]ETH40270.1 ABC transporter, permease protein [Bordetella pertussis H918]ETH43213.1 ABC transporter, permease protein [Bordetella pertussis H939]ETH47489.1 ABC transporter, permease protein [Bordetella pertussis H921]ETH70448.1 ABC transporter, permease protein [Bordetella pertussis STO1-CHLA-0011]ETH83567.1 ABC transporter, permease protein [Bordetella pertussis STO1-CHOC-0017]ETH89106.1 ABC transporter, permease protein [Bordetella pertussis 